VVRFAEAALNSQPKHNQLVHGKNTENSTNTVISKKRFFIDE